MAPAWRASLSVSFSNFNDFAMSPASLVVTLRLRRRATLSRHCLRSATFTLGSSGPMVPLARPRNPRSTGGSSRSCGRRGVSPTMPAKWLEPGPAGLNTTTHAPCPSRCSTPSGSTTVPTPVTVGSRSGSGANPNGGDAHASRASRSLNTGTVRKDSVTTGRPAGPNGTRTVAPGNRPGSMWLRRPAAILRRASATISGLRTSSSPAVTGKLLTVRTYLRPSRTHRWTHRSRPPGTGGPKSLVRRPTGWTGQVCWRPGSFRWPPGQRRDPRQPAAVSQAELSGPTEESKLPASEPMAGAAAESPPGSTSISNVLVSFRLSVALGLPVGLSRS